MSDSPNVDLVRRLYDSGMAPEVIAQVIDPDLVWDITPGFPNGGVYYGWDSVGRDFFGPMMPSFESFGPRPEQFYGDDDRVFVLGHYEAITKTGHKADVRFVHVWTVRDGRLARMQQTADSQVLRDALSTEPPSANAPSRSTRPPSKGATP